MPYISINKIDFDPETLGKIQKTSIRKHRDNFIEALKLCKNSKDIFKVLGASINVLHEKMEHLEKTKEN
jgi:hypothetical protein